MDAPDIQKGGAPYIKYLIIVSSVIALFAVATVISKSLTENSESNNRRTFIKSNGLPEGFFYSEKDSVIIPIVEIGQKQKKQKKKKRKSKIKARKVLSAKDAFILQKKIELLIAQNSLRDAFNNKRRLSGIIKVAMNDESNGKNNSFKKNMNEGKEWGNQGLLNDIASLPTNLSRTLTADKMIPCLLVNEIITDLGGQVTCKVEENIYSSHGRNILIPAGSSAIGRFLPLKKVGDERVRLTWNRIITPNGININTTLAELTDTMGRSGATAIIDRRYTEKYGLALLFSTISSLAAFQVPVQSVNQQIIISNYTKDLSSTTNKILDEQINIKPRGRVPAGSRIFINPVRDIWFSKLKNNTINLSFKE